jgi:hypothetical protein
MLARLVARASDRPSLSALGATGERTGLNRADRPQSRQLPSSYQVTPVSPLTC